MRNFLGLIVFLAVVVSCDDGDIITVNLDFDGQLERCDNFTSQYIMYDIRQDPPESLSLIFPRNNTTIAYFDTATDPATPIRLDLSTADNIFNYRTYNTDPTFCEILSDPSVTIVEDFPATAGIVTIVTTITDTDDDGIPDEDEGADPNGDGDFTDSTDTDGDGLYDYIDQDDDNDNVLTVDEDDNTDEDNNPNTNPRDTDGDGIVDYLDNDDDGDGIETRLEDENQNLNPTDDLLQDLPGETPRFLNNAATDAYDDPGLRAVQYTRTFTTTFTIEDLAIEIISNDLFNFGTFTRTETITVDNN